MSTKYRTNYIYRPFATPCRTTCSLKTIPDSCWDKAYYELRARPPVVSTGQYYIRSQIEKRRYVREILLYEDNHKGATTDFATLGWRITSGSRRNTADSDAHCVKGSPYVSCN